MRRLLLAPVLALLAACATPRWPATPAALAPTSSAAIPADCPAANPSASLPDRSSGLAPADAVSRYLDQGGDPAAAIAGLVGLGWVSSSSKAVWTDLDGDESLDLAAGLVSDPDDPATPAAGGVFAWQCRGGGYVRTEFAPPRAGYEPPALREARDLTGDGVAELVVAYPLCGAHTCFAQFAVYLWDGTSWVDRFRGASDEIPTPELSIETGNPSAPSTLEITATGIGSIGAGPFRSWSRSWSWDDPAQAFVAGPAVLEPPRYRIHALHDGDDAFRRGELETALDLYDRVVNDDELLDWPAPGDRRAELAAYASFRRVLAYLVQDAPDRAQAELAGRLTDSSPTGSAFAELARRLLAAYANGALDGACAAAAPFIAENAGALLTPLDFGYENRSYTAADICPGALP